MRKKAVKKIEKEKIVIIQEKKPEKSKELEEKIEEIVQKKEIQNLFQPIIMRNSPSLEVQQTRNLPKLEEDVAFTPTKPAQKENRINYSNIEQMNNSTYTPYVSPSLIPKMQAAKKTELIDPFEQRNLTQENLRPAMVETGTIASKRRLPFEQENKKYKEVKI